MAKRSSYHTSTVCMTNDLMREAECLWAAEAKAKPDAGKALSAEWGCVALLVNPNLTKSDQLRTILDGWKERVSDERCYGQLKSAVDEETVVDESGRIKIPWPESEDRSDLKIDMLLATATNPQIVGGHYPSAQRVAAAWNTRNGRDHIDYFCKNRANKIKTFQDDCIQKHLRALWQSGYALASLDSKYLGGVLWDLSRRTKAFLRHHSAIL